MPFLSEARSVLSKVTLSQFQATRLWPSTSLPLITRVVLCFAIGLLVGCEKKEPPPKPGPPEVLVAAVAEQNVPISNDWVAQLNGPVNADITPKVQGYLLRQEYQNGYFVKKGQLLFELDPRQYQAAVDQAKATLERTQAEVERFQNDVTRDTPLAAQNAIPQKQLDNDVASLNASKAQILADQAALDNAKLNLAWTKVYSPIDGIAGVSNSQIGDLVGTTTKMTVVSQVNPIWAYFNISESVYLATLSRSPGLFVKAARGPPLPLLTFKPTERSILTPGASSQ